MKKGLAILMAVMLAVASFAAFAETVTATGTWYASMMGTSIVLTLNEDGSAVLSSDGVEAPATWTQEGNQISVTAEGEDGTETMVLNWEDGILKETTTGLFNFYDSEEAAAGDTSMEDLLAMLTDAFSGTGEESETASAEPQGVMSLNTATDLTILRENLNLYDSYGSIQAVYIAEVQNDKDVPIFITDGAMTLVDGEGNDLDSTEWFNYNGSTYLEPGEKSFVSLSINPEGEAAIAGCRVEIQSSEESYYNRDAQLELKAAEYAPKDPSDFWSSDSIRVTIENPMDQNLAQISIVTVLEDDNGCMISIDAQGMYSMELTPGSSVVMVDSVPSYVNDWCAANGITPTRVTAYAWYTIQE